MPGRYVGSSNGDDEGEEFEARMPHLLGELRQQFEEADKLTKEILNNLEGIVSSE